MKSIALQNQVPTFFAFGHAVRSAWSRFVCCLRLHLYCGRDYRFPSWQPPILVTGIVYYRHQLHQPKLTPPLLTAKLHFTCLQQVLYSPLVYPRKTLDTPALPPADALESTHMLRRKA